MTTEDSLAMLVLVILLLSVLVWIGFWIGFIAKVRRERTVRNRAVMQTAVQIGIGAVFTGFLTVVMGLVLQTPPSGGMPALSYVFLFTICPGVFALAALVGFLRSAMELRREYQMTGEPHSERNPDN